jgi:hypothetical protein
MTVFSMRAALRLFVGGKKKNKSVFRSEKEAYDFCRRVYKESGGVPPELRRTYDFYLKNYNGDCAETGPERDNNHAVAWR